MRIYIIFCALVYSVIQLTHLFLGGGWILALYVGCHLMVSFVIYKYILLNAYLRLIVLLFILASLWGISGILMYNFVFNVFVALLFVAFFAPFYFYSIKWFFNQSLKVG